MIMTWPVVDRVKYGWLWPSWYFELDLSLDGHPKWLVKSYLVHLGKTSDKKVSKQLIKKVEDHE